MLFCAVTVLIGVAILVIIKYSLWRKQCCQNLPGIEPRFFNIPGDLTTIFMGVLSKKGPPHSDDNQVRVWRPHDETINPAFALQRHTAPTAGVMVWGPLPTIDGHP
ncbi:hypothetical protein TNCV_576081 [Trichonephila clavipes]|nr:hypothetical protein TNCV_576081 [Trichonephila clavipes]